MNETEYKPVYLIQGFLESGKTSFIQKLLENKTFAQDERMPGAEDSYRIKRNVAPC